MTIYIAYRVYVGTLSAEIVTTVSAEIVTTAYEERSI